MSSIANHGAKWHCDIPLTIYGRNKHSEYMYYRKLLKNLFENLVTAASNKRSFHHLYMYYYNKYTIMNINPSVITYDLLL